ncbi:MAG: hypothetical protein KC996_05045 [Phycisphaerales bacterium]|nr:hypothetical protein [Phycisphaerales bacterium]
MEDLIRELMGNEKLFIVVIIAGAITVMSIIKAFTSMVTGLAGERTRREVAAYIAEGSMTPEQGQKLLGKKNNGTRGCG